MITRKKLFHTILLFGLLSCLSAQEFSRIEIGEAEINEELDRIIKQNSMGGVEIKSEEIPQLKENIREGILMRKILVSLAHYRKIVIPTEDINEALKLTRGDYPLAEWQNLLSQQGYTEESFKQVLEDSLLIDRILEMEVLNDIRVTDEEVRKYYDDNTEEFTTNYGILALSEVYELIKQNLLTVKGQREVSRFMDDLYARAMFIEKE